MADGPEADGTARRLLWFVGLWLAGVLTVGSIAFLIRAVLKG